MSPIGLLRKAKSFRHNCEKNNNNNGESYLNFRTNRRQSFSCDSKVDTTDSHRSNFLTTLHNWRRREKEKRTLSVADRRKSVSISDVCEIKSMRQVEQESDLNIFRSDGNLPNIDESPINTEAFKSDFRAKLENVLAKGPPPKIHVRTSDEEEDKSHGVEIRRDSSQVLRYEGGRSKTCFLYPGNRLVRPHVVREGRFERVKVGTAPGKRALPRNWVRHCYGIVLSDGHVHISEEQDACKKSTQIKLPSPIQEITPSVHVEILDISGARVVRGTTHSSKKNIIELTPVDERIILLQNDDGSTTEAWYQDLISVAGPQKAGSLPRSNSLRVKNIPNSAVGGVNDTTVKHLKNFFGGGKRPSRETLENKGIYKSEPVFGNRLDALCAREAGTSTIQPPIFVKECIKVLGKEPHIQQVGLYRISGNLSHIQRLRLRVDQGKTNAISEEKETDVLAGALKLFFRELRHSLLPYNVYIQLVDEVDTYKVRKLLNKLLPQENLATLAALCAHLASVCKYERENQMNAQSMAIVWGPSLTWPDEDSQDAMLQCTRVNSLIEYLIINEKVLF